MTPSDVDFAAIAAQVLLWVVAAVAATGTLIGAGLGLRAGLSTVFRMVSKAFGR
jgi:hypothetical protein